MSSAFSVAPVMYLLVPAAFLIGSIPFGILFTRNKGVDLRSTGSKNIGATNVLRSAGKTAAILTLLGDMLKGAIPVIICKYIILHTGNSAQEVDHSIIAVDLWPGIVGLAAVLGHMYSIFLSFKGGKGVATGLGVLLIYSPAVAGIMLLVWFSLVFIFRYSSLAAIGAVTVMPILLFLFNASTLKISIGIIIAVLIINKHKSNIRKLIAGTESKIGGK